jgi:hypothetical protein
MAPRSTLFHANAKLPWLRSRSQDKRRPADELGVMAGRTDACSHPLSPP